MSDSQGLVFTPLPVKLPILKDFTLFLNVPSYLVRGEEIVLEINVLNHLEKELEVVVFVAKSAAFEFVLGKNGDISVTNAQKLTPGSQALAVARFPIRPLVHGEMEISVDAFCAESSESLVWNVFVKHEGVEQTFSQTLFLNLGISKDNDSYSLSFPFPPDVIPGSQKTYVALVGDLLGLSIEHLDSLVQMPQGCGEQNMIHFTPNIYVLDYLRAVAVTDGVIIEEALDRLWKGYQRQLMYQRDDGSFSAFGNRDASGNIWLTAYVVQSFLQAQRYIPINHSVLTRANAWLMNHQRADGEFREVGSLIHTELQPALDVDSVALTAYVLITLLTNKSSESLYSAKEALAEAYLESKLTTGVASNYSLALVAYALALANNPVAHTALEELQRRAEVIDGVSMWRTSAGLRSANLQPYSAQIEITSYILLARYLRAELQSIELLTWLSRQRNYMGSFGSTQDTVAALKALSVYAVFSGASAIDVRVNVSDPTSSLHSPFFINGTNYLEYQVLELDAYNGSPINVDIEGRGFALFQMNVFYNVESAALSQNLEPTADDAFSLTVELSEEEDHNHLVLRICMSLEERQVIPQTGMVILDVGLLSGFRASPGAAATNDLIRRVESLPDRIYLYLVLLDKLEVCVNLPLIRIYKISRVQDAVVRLYDYYEPNRKAVRTYNSYFLHNMNSCFFCGPNCDLCRPGIIISSNSTQTSHSGNTAPYRLMGTILSVTVLLLT